jgi:hypothetical protein
MPQLPNEAKFLSGPLIVLDFIPVESEGVGKVGGLLSINQLKGGVAIA